MPVAGVWLPDRSTAFLVIGLLLLVASGAMREFVWADLRAGLLDLRGLSRSTKILVGAVLLFLVALIVGLTLHEFWRATFTLDVTRAGTPGRGTLVARPLLPVSLFLIGLGVSIALTGALHVRRSLRVIAVLLYLSIVGDWANLARGLEVGERWQRTVILAGLAAVPIFFAIRWRAKARPVFEFCVLFAVTSITLGLCEELIVQADRQFGGGGVSLATSEAAEVIAGLGLFALPFLFFIGLDIAELGLRASGWTVQIVRTKLGGFVRQASYLLLAALAVVRLHTVVTQLQEHLDTDPPGMWWKRYVSAAGVVAVIAVAWFVFARRGASTDIHPERVAGKGRSIGVVLAFVFLAPTMLAEMLVQLSFVADTAGLPGSGRSTSLHALDFANWVSDNIPHWTAIVGAGALVAAVLLKRRGARPAALFLAITGGIVAWSYLTNSPRPLHELDNAWTFDHSYIDFWLVLVLPCVAMYWAVTQRLTVLRAQTVLMLLVLSSLIAHSDFLENPFDTFFGVAGIALFAFTVAFDLVTIGSWANVGTEGLPRTSRLFAYLGFVLFSLVLVNWALVTHDLAKVDLFTGQGALLGFREIGLPMLYGVGAVALTMAGRDDDPLEDLEEVEGALTLMGVGAKPPRPGMTPF